MSHLVKLPQDAKHNQFAYIDPDDVRHIIPHDRDAATILYTYGGESFRIEALTADVEARLFSQPTEPLSRVASWRIGTWLVRLAFVLVAFLIVPLSSFAESADDYHALSISTIMSMDVSHPEHWHSHVEITGFAEYIHRERDGDVHIRLSDVTGCEIVTECIPQVPMCATLKLRKGDAVKVRGLLYYDYKHANTQGGWEIHPITSIEEIKK